MEPTSSDRRRTVAAIVLVAVAMVALYGMLGLNRAAIESLTREDGPVETAGALALLAACVLCVLTWRRAQNWARIARLSLLGLAVMFFFGFGEEISWGQRILGIETPASLKQANGQQEINLHNFNTLSGIFDLDYAFRDFWLVFGVLIPLLALWKPARRRLAGLIAILPTWTAVALLANKVMESVAQHVLRQRPDLQPPFDLNDGVVEVKETVACIILAIALYLVYSRAGGGRTTATDGKPGRRWGPRTPPSKIG